MDNKTVLINIIAQASKELYQEENLMHFVPYNRTDANTWWYSNEEAVMFRFAYHFQLLLNKLEDYSKLHLDCNCDHDGKEPITIPNYSDAGRIKPDMILHKRNTNELNKLVIEMKMDNASNSARSRDRKKLKELTRSTGAYHYEMGVLIIWGLSEETTRIEIYENGELLKKCSIRTLKAEKIV